MWTVRTAVADDAETLAGFNRAMAQETEQRALAEATVASGVRAVLNDPMAGFYLVALDDQERVGSMMITPEWSDWRNAWYWWIQSVYVLPAFRRRGVYRALYDAARSLATQRGDVCGFRLYVERDNVDAQRTYEALGMQETRYLLYEEPLDEPTR